LPVTTVLIWSKVFGMVLAVPVIAAPGLPSLRDPHVGWAVAAGLIGLPAMGLLYRAMRDGSMIVVAPVAAAAALVPVGWGLIGGERFGPAGWIGVAVALVGVTLASWPVSRAPDRTSLAGGSARALAGGSDRSLAGGPGGAGRALVGGTGGPLTVLSALGAALGFGAYFVLLHEASPTDPYQVTAIARISGGVGALLLAGVLMLRRSRNPGDRNRPCAPGDPAPATVGPRASAAATGRPGTATIAAVAAMCGIGALDAAGDAAFVFAAHHGSLGATALLASMYPAVTVLLNRSVLRERIHAVHLCGVVAALFAVACFAA
jgi:drug/metabolite transporter (DMT)-like permease